MPNEFASKLDTKVHIACKELELAYVKQPPESAVFDGFVVHELNVLETLSFFVLSRCQMTVDKCEPGRVDLHEQHNSSFMARVAFETSFNIVPLKVMYPF